MNTWLVHVVLGTCSILGTCRFMEIPTRLVIFRRAERLSRRIARTIAGIDFLQICESFDVTPTFAKLDNNRHVKWKHSSDTFERRCIQEELRNKVCVLHELLSELNSVIGNIRRTFPLVSYLVSIKLLASFKLEELDKSSSTHQRKLSKLLQSRSLDDNIDNRSSYQLSFVEKLLLARGLDFSFPGTSKINPNSIRASFDKAAFQISWELNKQEVSDDRVNTIDRLTATLKTLSEKYCAVRKPLLPRPFREAICNLCKRNDIVISKPDKGNGIVILDKDVYISLLESASVQDTTKFREVSREQPRRVGRPSKFYHPLLEREKHTEKLLTACLPMKLAKELSPKGSRLAHLYGLPKTHKPTLTMRPILSASGTYNFDLAKWLDNLLKPLASNEFTVTDTFKFAKEMSTIEMAPGDYMVSYDVTALFTSVPLDEAIDFLVSQAFHNNWICDKIDFELSPSQLKSLLEAATKNQLFQFNGKLYEQFDGVAMGSPLGPLIANAFMCKLEKQFASHPLFPKLYRRYVDDTITIFPNKAASLHFLDFLNNLHPAITFTIEHEVDGILPFIGINISRSNESVDTSVHHKTTDKGLLLQYHSHCDHKYHKALIKTMLSRIYRISSSWQFFHSECLYLRSVFHKLCYPKHLVLRTIRDFLNRTVQDSPTDVDVRHKDYPANCLRSGTSCPPALHPTSLRRSSSFDCLRSCHSRATSSSTTCTRRRASSADSRAPPAILPRCATEELVSCPTPALPIPPQAHATTRLATTSTPRDLEGTALSRSSASINPIRLILPFINQKLCTLVRAELRSLGTSLRCPSPIVPVFTSSKIGRALRPTEPKEPLVSQSLVVYEYTCACDMRYVGHTTRHLHQRATEHQRATSAIKQHCQASKHEFSFERFKVIAKCRSALDCKIRESVEIYFRKPQINRRDEYQHSLLYRTHYN